MESRHLILVKMDGKWNYVCPRGALSHSYPDGIRGDHQDYFCFKRIDSSIWKSFHLLAIDELDAGIFEYMLGELLDIFQNSAKGQLIFTSHNLRAIEMLDKESIMFSTANPENRYIHMKNVKGSNNLRSMYIPVSLLAGRMS